MKYHVIYQGEKWALRRTSSMKALKLFESQADAIKYWELKFSHNEDSSLYVHAKDGTVEYKL
jgi:hypothetical protein